MSAEPAGKQEAGLCANCAHGRRVESAKGSTYWLCELSRTDARFARYPRLPVLTCAGHEPRAKSEAN